MIPPYKPLLLQRQYDSFLMDDFYRQGYRKNDLQQLNHCPMFLHAVTISDISNCDGRHIVLLGWQGRRGPSRVSLYQWTRQHPLLSSSHWRLWQLALEKTYTSSSASSYMLIIPLGPWIDFRISIWNWFYSHTEN